MEYLGYVTGGIDFGPDTQYGEFKALGFKQDDTGKIRSVNSFQKKFMLRIT